MAAPETRKKALAGSAWTLFGYGGAQVIRLGSNLILAHMLYPAAFGVMALVTVFMQGLQMFSEVGIGPSIIQNRRGDDPAFLDTAWTIQVLRGFGLWIFTCVLAWPTALFFGQNDPLAKDLLYILPVIGLTSILGGFNSTAVFSLNRHLQVGKATLLRILMGLAAPSHGEVRIARNGAFERDKINRLVAALDLRDTQAVALESGQNRRWPEQEEAVADRAAHLHVKFSEQPPVMDFPCLNHRLQRLVILRLRR